MTEWTNSARKTVDDYLAQMRRSIEDSGADPAEVVDDLRRHVDEEVSLAGLSVVTEKDVRRILDRIGPPEQPATPAASESVTTAVQKSRMPFRLGLLFWGVILPVVTIGLELVTHMCAGAFFDPIPTWWHVALVCTVPMANFFAWQVLRTSTEAWLRPLGWANAFGIAVSAVYSLLYLPLVPFAAVAVIFLGWGLLPLSPVCSLIAACSLRSHLRHRARQASLKSLPGFWGGLLLGTTVIVLTFIPTMMTRHLANLAVSESPQTRSVAVRWLRRVGSQKVLLTDCYGATRWSAENPFGISPTGKPLPAEEARKVFFRVSGKAFNSVPPPQLNYRGRGWDVLGEWTWDSEQGGDAVAGRVKGLALSQSRIDGLIDPDVAWSYVEWIMEFRNSAENPREARAQIALPPGGFVSRLTLWVNGEEREAAFAGSSDVREAYRQVAVVQRRDPVLVTSCGLDRVMMQCFPVPARGGTMKIRIGITAPAILPASDQAAVVLPSFLERNFGISPETRHSTWVESPRLLLSSTAALQPHQLKPDRFGLHGELADSELGSSGSTIFARRASERERSWVMDHATDDKALIWQTAKSAPAWKPARIVLVLDGTAGMAEFYPQIVQVLSNLPPSTEFAVVQAGDHLRTSAVVPSNGESIRRISGFIADLKAVGGQDNVEALVRAWDLATVKTNSAIVWVHGPQPVTVGALETLQQRLLWQAYSAGGLRIFDIQTRPGPNRLLEKFDATSPFISLPHLGSFAGDLQRLFVSWHDGREELHFVRERAVSTNVVVANLGKQSSKHLSRLWAYDEILRKISARKRSEAIVLAGRYQLVTPVSGAVVLENAIQFAQAGLKPVDPGTVPTVPEPSTFALTIGCLALLALARSGGRRLSRTGTTPS